MFNDAVCDVPVPMMRSWRPRPAWFARFSAASALAALGACGGAKLEVPADLAPSTRLNVSGRLGWANTERLRFGGYTAELVGDTRVRGSSVGIGGFQRGRRRQGYTLVLTGPDTKPLRAECNANVVVKGINIGHTLGMDDRSSLRCDLRDDSVAVGPLWKLAIEDDGKSPMSGALTLGADSVLVTGTSRTDGGSMPSTITTGYYFTRDGRTIAAVEVLGDGAVWLNTTDLAERARLAAMAAALLVAEDLRAPVAS